MVKNPPASAGDPGDMGLIPGSGRSPRKRNGNTLGYSCLGNPMDRGAWQATVNGVAKNTPCPAKKKTATEHNLVNDFKSLR